MESSENSKIILVKNSEGKFELKNITQDQNSENFVHSQNLNTEDMNHQSNGEDSKRVSINELSPEEILYIYYRTKLVKLSAEKYFEPSKKKFEDAVKHFNNLLKGVNDPTMKEIFQSQLDKALEEAEKMQSIDDLEEYRISKGIVAKLEAPAALIEDVYPDMARRMLEEIKKTIKGSV